ncbi:hypothetical protein D3C84_347970 [compost metagenome]
MVASTRQSYIKKIIPLYGFLERKILIGAIEHLGRNQLQRAIIIVVGPITPISRVIDVSEMHRRVLKPLAGVHRHHVDGIQSPRFWWHATISKLFTDTPAQFFSKQKLGETGLTCVTIAIAYGIDEEPKRKPGGVRRNGKVTRIWKPVATIQNECGHEYPGLCITRKTLEQHGKVRFRQLPLHREPRNVLPDPAPTLMLSPTSFLRDTHEQLNVLRRHGKARILHQADQ